MRIVHEGYVTTDRRVVIGAQRLSPEVAVALSRTLAREVPTRGASETFIGTLPTVMENSAHCFDLGVMDLPEAK